MMLAVGADGDGERGERGRGKKMGVSINVLLCSGTARQKLISSKSVCSAFPVPRRESFGERGTGNTIGERLIIRPLREPEDSSRRWTALHFAAAGHSAGKSLIQRLLTLNPDAASASDGTGRRPLHLACTVGRSWIDGGTKAIFDADPLMALAADEDGFLPFHAAAMRGGTATPSPAGSAPPRGDGDDADDCEELEEDETTLDAAMREEVDREDLESLEVLFNLLIAQPSSVQS